MQKIEELNIICDISKKNNKANSLENKFYKCNSCNFNLCLSCELIHDKTHNIVNYDQKNYYCEIHNNELYNSYCKECKQNLCIICESFHNNNHLQEIIAFNKILPNKENINKELEDLKILIDNFKTQIKEFKDKLDNIFSNIIENFGIYYKIYNNLFNNYDIKNRNFQNLQNMNDINFENIKNNIKDFINESDLSVKLNNIIKIYDRINKQYNKNNNENNNKEDYSDKNINENNINYEPNARYADYPEKTFQIINNIREDPVGYADIIEDSMKYIMEEEDTKDPSKRNLIFKKK